jgi:hypothetical protein
MTYRRHDSISIFVSVFMGIYYLTTWMSLPYVVFPIFIDWNLKAFCYCLSDFHVQHRPICICIHDGCGVTLCLTERCPLFITVIEICSGFWIVATFCYGKSWGLVLYKVRNLLPPAWYISSTSTPDVAVSLCFWIDQIKYTNFKSYIDNYTLSGSSPLCGLTESRGIYWNVFHKGSQTVF